MKDQLLSFAELQIADLKQKADKLEIQNSDLLSLLQQSSPRGVQAPDSPRQSATALEKTIADLEHSLHTANAN